LQLIKLTVEKETTSFFLSLFLGRTSTYSQ